MDDTFFKQSEDDYIIESNYFINLYFGCTGMRYFQLNKVKIIPVDKPITIIFNINEYKQNIEISSEIVVRQCININKSNYYNLKINEEIVGTKEFFWNGSIMINGKCIIVQNKEMIVDC